MPATLRATLSTRRRSGSVLVLLARALTLHRQRARLLQLDEHILRDIGLTRDDALAEARRPLWDVPTHWRG